MNRNVLGRIGYVPPSDKITVAFIGTGTQGIRHLMKHIAHPEIKIVAVCDPNKDSMDYVEWSDGELRSKIRQFLYDDKWGEGIKGCRAGRVLGKELVNAYYARELGKNDYDGCRTYADYREMLEHEIDLDAQIDSFEWINELRIVLPMHIFLNRV